MQLEFYSKKKMMKKIKSVYGEVMPIDFVNELRTLVERFKKVCEKSVVIKADNSGKHVR